MLLEGSGSTRQMGDNMLLLLENMNKDKGKDRSQAPVMLDGVEQESGRERMHILVRGRSIQRGHSSSGNVQGTADADETEIRLSY